MHALIALDCGRLKAGAVAHCRLGGDGKRLEDVRGRERAVTMQQNHDLLLCVVI